MALFSWALLRGFGRDHFLDAPIEEFKHVCVLLFDAILIHGVILFGWQGQMLRALLAVNHAHLGVSGYVISAFCVEDFGNELWIIELVCEGHIPSSRSFCFVSDCLVLHRLFLRG